MKNIEIDLPARRELERLIRKTLARPSFAMRVKTKFSRKVKHKKAWA